MTKAEQEKLVAVTNASQRKEVAQLDADSAALYKTKLVREGEGESEKRRLLMAADNALDARLAAYVKVQEAWAGAFKEFKGEIVPRIVQGGGPGASSNAATSFMDLMSMKAAQDLAVSPNTTQRPPQAR